MHSLTLRILLSVALVFGFCSNLLAEDWPQWRGPDRDGRWTESGIITEFESDQIEILWRQPIGSGYSGPTVADERVFVMDRKTDPEQVERVLCFDSKSGQPLWTYTYPCVYRGIDYAAGPRASVSVDDDRAYALGTMGHLHCLDVGGGLLWKKDLNAEYEIQTDIRSSNRMPNWGISASPLIYDDLVILHVGGRDGACVIALDKKSGDEQWRALDDRAQYSAPIVIQQEGRDVIVCWTGDSVAGINPKDGEVLWRFPFAPVKMPIGIATPVVEGDTLFMTSFYDGSLMLRTPANRIGVQPIWQINGESERKTAALQSIISTPLVKDGYIYGVDSYGEFRCLDAKTGQRIWEDATAVPNARWSTIHFIQNGDKTWMFNERGELIIAELSPAGFKEISRAQLIEPTSDQLRQRGGVCWSHPAFADRSVFARNDKELVCASLED